MPRKRATHFAVRRPAASSPPTRRERADATPVTRLLFGEGFAGEGLPPAPNPSTHPSGHSTMLRRAPDSRSVHGRTRHGAGNDMKVQLSHAVRRVHLRPACTHPGLGAEARSVVVGEPRTRGAAAGGSEPESGVGERVARTGSRVNTRSVWMGGCGAWAGRRNPCFTTTDRVGFDPRSAIRDPRSAIRDPRHSAFAARWEPFPSACGTDVPSAAHVCLPRVCGMERIAAPIGFTTIDLFQGGRVVPPVS